MDFLDGTGNYLKQVELARRLEIIKIDVVAP
jgi:hypothetical protein